MAELRDKSNSFDSGQQYLGNVYAKALLGVTENSHNTPAVLDEFDSLLADVLDRLPQFAATLSSPRVPHADKLRMLEKAFADKMSPQLLTFLKVVSQHGRLDCLRAINRAAHRIYDEMRGRVAVQIRTAEPVGGDVLQAIVAKLQSSLGCEVVLTTKVDPNLIGGLVVRVGDTVFDGSVANQLNRMKDAALDATAQQLRQAFDRYVVAG